MIKYKIELYIGKQEEEKLKENENHIVFKEVHNGKGYACTGIFKGTYLDCLRYRKEKITNE